MAEIIEGKFTYEVEDDEMVPMEEWDGECWKTMFDTLAELLPDVNPWDSLAAFIKKTLMKDDGNE